ncbi:uncharacterized protein LOC131152960 [Malania oleifera]|uniref:uncharacterized protein LOC131152960 n=1 Tax=Malania oleifera TaxID=397392 RepID=UPI0025ADF5E3|nr:uncharacterized protein LOC131152960 [Malania oleifera]XP_057960913.1 uncharacterized protein LOC131152960 [Malania oleifera]XP_057960914.1 uncharacterized protein LOC131152960 [Malania oleifera]XP_057960916.1 uncharacterized protein LOC131152960 [Malania oleifera]
MLMVHALGAVGTCQAYSDTITLHKASSCNIIHVNPLLNCIASPGHSKSLPSVGLLCSSISGKGCSLLKSYHLSHQVASKKWLCQLHDSITSDDEYRSSRNIAISLFRRYKNFVDRGGGDNLKEFISAGVNAYALGCTDEGLRKELTDMRECGVEIEVMQSYGGNTSLKSKIFSEEVDECILWLSIIFITILCTPQPTIVRWSSTPPVSDEIMLQWKGFCALIANAYYIRGMAWLPVKTLQLEQLAVVGRAEEPSVVASRMRLVFSTLEVVSPQWPRV